MRDVNVQMEKIVLTPEQLYFLGECMDAKYIDYDYVAAMHELNRNYQRSRRKYISQLAQDGLVRERLSGEIAVRPLPEKLLGNVFFGETETTLQVIEPNKAEGSVTWRFHWHEESVTQVRTTGDVLEVSACSQEAVCDLVSRLVDTAPEPRPLSRLTREQVEKILMAKKAVVGKSSAILVLFQQDGGLYTTDEAGNPTGISCEQGRLLLQQALKGE